MLTSVRSVFGSVVFGTLCLSSVSAFADTFTSDNPLTLDYRTLGRATLTVDQDSVSGSEFTLTLSMEDVRSGIVVLRHPNGYAVRPKDGETLSRFFTSAAPHTGPHTETLTFMLPPGAGVDGDWELIVKARAADFRAPVLLKQWSLNFPDNGGSSFNVPPVAEFTYEANGLAVNFESQSYDSDGKLVDLAWDFGDGGFAMGVKTRYVYTRPGTYVVNLTAVDDLGAKTEYSQQIVVVPNRDGRIGDSRRASQLSDGTLPLPETGDVQQLSDGTLPFGMIRNVPQLSDGTLPLPSARNVQRYNEGTLPIPR